MNITLTLAWRNLWRHRRRTWLTVSAMVFCNILLIFAISLQFGTYGLMIENSLKLFTGHLQVQHPEYMESSKLRHSIADADATIEQLQPLLPEGTRLSARAAGFALISSAERSFGVQILGVDPQHEPGVSSLPGQIKQGSYLHRDNSENHDIPMVIGIKMATNLRVSLGDELTLLGSGRDGSFAAGIARVVGIFESGVAEMDRSMAQIPLQDFQQLFTMEGHAHAIVIHGSSAAHADLLKQQLQQQLQSHLQTQQNTDNRNSAPLVRHWDELLPGIRQAIQSDMASSLFLYGILTLLVAFSVLNTQLMSVLERTREFGILTALGVTPGQLGRLIMLESLLMGLLGFVIGIAGGALLVYWLSVVGLSMPGMEEMSSRFNMPARIYPQPAPLALSLGPGVILGFSLLATLYPALRVLRLQPVAAMRAA